MKKNDFKELADYASKNWNGKFSEAEKKEMAEELYQDFLLSKKNKKKEHSMDTLCRNLEEDMTNNPENKQVKQWLERICQGIK